MLHIHNGDSAADTAKQSSLPGEHLAWRESLITGPTPAGLTDDEWLLLRARHLSASYGVDLQECEQSLRQQEETLRSSAQHDEVVLWFEHDLFCQVHLLYLLNWFSRRDEINNPGKTKLSLICVGEFPGKETFRGLGELNAGQLASLFPDRQQVTSRQLKLASSAWGAYCSANPTDIEKVLQGDTSPLPFLLAALQAHLRRFPDTENGLGRIEHRALKLIQEGCKTFGTLFSRFGDEEPVYGFGDAQFWLTLRRMSAAQKPLLTIATGKNSEDEGNGERGPRLPTPEVVWNAEFKLTELGQSALRSEVDFVKLNGIDLWLGGVHLYDKTKPWRWSVDHIV